MPKFKRPEPIMVGPASKEIKEKAKQRILSRFGEGHYEQLPEEKRKILESLEYPKRPYEESAIDRANEISNSLLQEFDLQPFDVPEQNVHIMPEKLFKEVEKNNDRVAVTFQDKQAIAVNAERSAEPLNRALHIFHEIIHLKGFSAIEVHEDLDKMHRSGFKVNATRKKSEKRGYFVAFEGLNEAVVAEIEKTYSQRFLKENEFLKEEYEWEMSEEAQKLKQTSAKEWGIETDEITHISKDGKVGDSFSYYEQRKVLYYIVDRLLENNPDKFKSRDTVKKLFFKSHFDGKLLNIAGLIEKSFGKGSFRMVGMMDTDKNSARLVMDYLFKHRTKSPEK